MKDLMVFATQYRPKVKRSCKKLEDGGRAKGGPGIVEGGRF